MELSVAQALQKGIEAHKAGRAQEADQYYTAILKAQPKHPDANHNMGVLAVGVGKVEEALPFFKTALEANSSISQFWLSYINALVRLNRLEDAKAVFDQAKNSGAKGDGFDQIEKSLSQSAKIDDCQNNQEILNKALKLRESGEYDKAIELLKKGISQFPEEISFKAIIAHCYILIDDLDEAAFHLDQARKIDTDHTAVNWNLARLHLKKQEISHPLATTII